MCVRVFVRVHAHAVHVHVRNVHMHVRVHVGWLAQPDGRPFVTSQGSTSSPSDSLSPSQTGVRALAFALQVSKNPVASTPERTSSLSMTIVSILMLI